MKKLVYIFLLLATVGISSTNCREKKNPEEKIEDGVEEVGEGIEEGAEEVGDDIEDAVD
ncbi:hypothetical protein CJ739_554 [Mariniflexile rhizosphaerae]|uniref:hypothetical protein n=1 Tax=unclassified Mariniflexile TaxID=2643887 RepID=UPI000CC62413|nr:hypothetical protein [Mariniflexile sp. TRM1-10]AXP79651.1 hypothetical protein CJ739_554 [Mariniflexile sp. TRM1-10]PLB18945.1 MAG: hypothetical protein TRG1_2134 [Flavobacteriaceae bacterium FS1-H7996/R]